MLKIEMCGPILEGLIAARIVNQLLIGDIIASDDVEAALDTVSEVLDQSMPTIINPRPKPEEDQ